MRFAVGTLSFTAKHTRKYKFLNSIVFVLCFFQATTTVLLEITRSLSVDRFIHFF